VVPEVENGAVSAGIPAGKPNGEKYICVPDEKTLLKLFIDTVRETDPDVLAGWHVIGFDLAFLDGKSKQLGVPLLIGRGERPLRISDYNSSGMFAETEGRLIIDGPPALRGTFHKFSNWKLDTVALELLGRGKEIVSSGTEKVEEIERRFLSDKKALASYNLEDAVLVSEIFFRTGIVEQMITRSLITGMTPDQVHRSVASFDRFFLPRLHRKGYVAPSADREKESGGAPGGYVFTSGAGLYEYAAVLDFKSLYPSIIRTFNIDPYSLLKADEIINAAGMDNSQKINTGGNIPGGLLNTPAEIMFSAEEHILPGYLSELMARRAEAKKSGDKALSQAIKILMNSMYGVMGTRKCRFYDSRLPSAITRSGRWILKTTSERLESMGYKVLYGDTDSVFVKLKENEYADPEKAASLLASGMDDFFRTIIKQRFGAVSGLELEFEKIYVKLFLPAGRSGKGSAVKRYAGLLTDGSIEIKGMEFVRSDSTELAREFQYELFRKYFNGENPTEWIQETVKKLKEGAFDSKLVYHKRLSRPVESYKSPPPHVKAAKILLKHRKKEVREISFVITPDGPWPVELGKMKIDYNHYIEKQIKPLADDILIFTGKSFDGIIGGRQPGLFD
jgi:DNA polymerase-2